VGARPVRRSTQGGQKIRRKKPAAACGEGCSNTLLLTQRYSIEKIECGETRTKFVMRHRERGACIDFALQRLWEFFFFFIFFFIVISLLRWLTAFVLLAACCLLLAACCLLLAACCFLLAACCLLLAACCLLLAACCFLPAAACCCIIWILTTLVLCRCLTTSYRSNFVCAV